MDKRMTPDRMSDLRDAGCCTGMDVSDATQPSSAALARGFTKSGTGRRDPFSREDDGGTNYVGHVSEMGGFAGRPGGWER